MPGIVQDTKDVMVNKTKIPALLERVLMGETDSKIDNMSKIFYM